MKLALLAALLSTSLCATAYALEVSPPAQNEVRVAEVVVLKPARTTKEGFLFVSPARNSQIRKSLPLGTRLYVTGEQAAGRSEVWVEGMGEGWVPTSIIRVLEPDPK